MKSVWLSILSLIIFLASFQNTLLLVDYQINRDFYEMHCINKTQPKLNCHGKCEMKKQSEKENSSYKILKTALEFNILPIKIVEISIAISDFPRLKKPIFNSFQLNLNKGFFNILPHPPQISFS